MKQQIQGLKFVLAGLCLTCVGCGSSDELWPLKAGSSWTYTVRMPFYASAEELSVDRSISVAGQPGWLINSPMGQSRVAWKGDELVGEALAYSRFAPAVPLAVSGRYEAERKWAGTIYVLNSPFPAKATLAQVRASEDVMGQKMDGVKAILTIDIPKLQRQVVLENTLIRGVGLVRQLQRTNGVLDVDLRLLQLK